MHGGHSLLSGNNVEMYCKGNRIEITIRNNQVNLLIVYNLFVSTQEKKDIGPHIRSAMAYSNLSTLDLFGDLQTLNNMNGGKNIFENMINNEYEHYTQFCGTCVSSSENQNLYNSQKKNFLWHWRW